MLPRPIKFSDQDNRTTVMIRALESQGYDFVFMQEAFTTSFRGSLETALKKKYPYSYYLDSDSWFYPYFGSGLFVLSKYPMKILDQVYFTECASADCFAAKGSFLLESKLPSGKSIQVAVTHMQAGMELKKIRLSQFQQIQRMFRKFKRKGVPQVLVGDLNTTFEESDFKEGASLLGMKHIGLTGPVLHTNVIDCYKAPDHPKRWIDHMWFDQDTVLADSSLSVREVSYNFEGKNCMASDHHAVEGTFTFGK